MPISGLGEETTAGRANNVCCTFRGNVTGRSTSTVDTGAQLWKAYTVDEPKPRGKNARNGTEAFGPAVAASGRRPPSTLARRSSTSRPQRLRRSGRTVDRCRCREDMESGKVKWAYQGTSNYNWIGVLSAKTEGRVPVARRGWGLITTSRLADAGHDGDDN